MQLWFPIGFVVVELNWIGGDLRFGNMRIWLREETNMPGLPERTKSSTSKDSSSNSISSTDNNNSLAVLSNDNCPQYGLSYHQLEEVLFVANGNLHVLKLLWNDVTTFLWFQQSFIVFLRFSPFYVGSRLGKQQSEAMLVRLVLQSFMNAVGWNICTWSNCGNVKAFCSM